MRKPLVFTIIILISILIALWSPWLKWDIDLNKLVGVESAEDIAGLQLYSLSGELTLYIDGEEIDKVTTEDSPLIIDNIEPGSKIVRVVRESNVKDSFIEFSSLIDFEKNTAAVLSINLGPLKEFSEWHVISPVKKDDLSEENRLNINLNVESGELMLDDKPISITDSKATTQISLDKTHTLKILIPGYEEQSFSILPEDQSERDKLKDFDINIDIHLMQQPIVVE